MHPSEEAAASRSNGELFLLFQKTVVWWILSPSSLHKRGRNFKEGKLTKSSSLTDWDSIAHCTALGESELTISVPFWQRLTLSPKQPVFSHPYLEAWLILQAHNVTILLIRGESLFSFFLLSSSPFTSLALLPHSPPALRQVFF